MIPLQVFKHLLETFKEKQFKHIVVMSAINDLVSAISSFASELSLLFLTAIYGIFVFVIFKAYVKNRFPTSLRRISLNALGMAWFSGLLMVASTLQILYVRRDAGKVGIILSSSLGLAIGALLFLYSYYTLVRDTHLPLENLTQALVLADEGDLEVLISTHPKYEFAQAVQAFNSFLGKVGNAVYSVSVALEKQAILVRDSIPLVESLENVGENLRQSVDLALTTTAALTDELGKMRTEIQQMLTYYQGFYETSNEILKELADTTDRALVVALNAQIEAIQSTEGAGETFQIVASDLQNLSKQNSQIAENLQLQIEKLKDLSGKLQELLAKVNSYIEQLHEMPETMTQMPKLLQDYDANLKALQRSIQNSERLSLITQQALSIFNEAT